MFNKNHINAQEFSNFIYYTMAEKGYFVEIIEELPEKLSEHNSDLFIYFEISEIRNASAIFHADALISLFMKSSKQGKEKSDLETKFNELLSDAYGTSSKLEGFERFGTSKSLLPRIPENRDGYTIINQPIVIRKRNY